MRKWFSSLLYILIVLVIIILLLPVLFGFVAERKCKQMVETINTTTILTAKITNYQRGWFGANAIVQISLDKLKLSNQEPYQLTVTADITHGPIRIDWTRVRFVQAMIDGTVNFNKETVAALKIKFKLNGNTDVTLTSPSLTYQVGENALNWRGLDIKSVFSPFYDQVKSTINFAGIDVKTKNRNFLIGEVTGSYQGNRISSGIWLGERNLKFISFSTTNDNNRTISFNNLNLHSLIASGEKNFVNIATTITIADSNINGAIYDKNKLDLEINRIDQTLFAKLQQLVTDKIVSSPTDTGFDIIMAILNNGSEINIKQLDTVAPWGEMFANIKIGFANQPDNIGLLATITNSNVSADLKADRGLALHLLEKFYQSIFAKQNGNPAKQAETLLAEWEQSGKVLTSKEDHYLHLNFGYKNNQLLVNGKQLILTTKS